MPSFFLPDILLKEGDRIESLTCIHLPGHTPGSIGLMDEGSKCLFAGDLFRSDGKILEAGPAAFSMDLVSELESQEASFWDLILTCCLQATAHICMCKQRKTSGSLRLHSQSTARYRKNPDYSG